MLISFTFNLSRDAQDFPKLNTEFAWGTEELRWDVSLHSPRCIDIVKLTPRQPRSSTKIIPNPTGLTHLRSARISMSDRPQVGTARQNLNGSHRAKTARMISFLSRYTTSRAINGESTTG